MEIDGEEFSGDEFGFQGKKVNPEKRKYTKTKAAMRNLHQYKNLSDEEFDKIWDGREKYTSIVTDFETLVAKKIESFGEDYDLSDLKANDKMSLKALAQAYVRLDMLEIYIYGLTKDGLNESNIVLMEKAGKAAADLRRSISEAQNDLNITRKIRKGDKEESVLAYIDSLKEKARKFYRAKMTYLVCPDCGMLLGTTWFQYPDEPRNRIILKCNRKLEDGTQCPGIIKLKGGEVEQGTSNTTDIPEFYQ